MLSLKYAAYQQTPNPEEVWHHFITCLNHYGELNLDLRLWRSILISLSTSTHSKALDRFRFVMSLLQKSEILLDPDAAFHIGSNLPIKYKDTPHILMWLKDYDHCFESPEGQRRFRVGFFQQLFRVGKWKEARTFLRRLRAVGEHRDERMILTEDMMYEIFRIVTKEGSLAIQRKAVRQDIQSRRFASIGRLASDCLVEVMNWARGEDVEVPLRLWNEWVATVSWEVDCFEKALETIQYIEDGGGNPDVTTFNMLLSYLGDRGRLEDAEKLVKEMERRGAEIDAVTCRHMITLYCHAKLPLKAYEYYTKKPAWQKDILTFRDSKRKLARRFALTLLDDTEAPLDPAMHVLHDITSISDDSIDPIWGHHILIVRLISHGRLNDATTHLFNLLNWPIPTLTPTAPTTPLPPLPPPHVRYTIPETYLKSYNTLITTYTKQSLPMALTLFHTLLSHAVTPTIETYTPLITTAFSTHNTPLALSLLSHLQSESRINPTPEFHAQLFKSLIRSQNMTMAQEILKMMAKSGVKPSKEIWLELFRSQLSEGKTLEAQKVLNRWVGSLEEMTGEELGVVLESYMKAGMLSECDKVRSEIIKRWETFDPAKKGVGKRDALSMRVLHPFVESLVRVGRVGEAESLVWSILEKFGKSGTLAVNQLIWNSIVGGYLMKGDLEAARRVVGELRGRRVRWVGPDTEVLFVEYFAREGMWEDAEVCLKKIGKDGRFKAFENAYVGLIKGARERREWDRMERFWNRFVEVAKKRGESVSSDAFAVAISAFATARKYDFAHEVLGRATRELPSVPLFVRTAAMNLFAKEGRVREMEEVLVSVRRGTDGGVGNGDVEEGWGTVMDATSYGILLDGYGRGGEVVKMVELFNRVWKQRKVELSDEVEEGGVLEVGNTEDRIHDTLTSYSPTTTPIPPSASPSPSTPLAITGPISNPQLFKTHGALPLHICLILDGLGFTSHSRSLTSFWRLIKSAGYPLEENCYTSYVEALVRVGRCEEAVEVVRGEMYGDGVDVGVKTVRNL
ncbi:hypothetical protein HK097_004384, partial [Rhizophlyctis rosea]